MWFGFDVSGLQLPLLVVELILLAVTLSLIAITRREFKGRGELMRRVSHATDAITKQEYFATVINTIQAAERYVYGVVTATPPTPAETAMVGVVMGSLSKAAARGVSVRYVVPHSPDRLPMARSYKMAGAELRFHPGLVVNDARFMIADDRSVIIGVPDRNGGDQPTKKAHNITSESVAHLFRERFESQWDSGEAKTYSQYLLELVAKARETTPNVSARVIANNLKVDEADIEYVDAIVTDSVPRAEGRRRRNTRGGQENDRFHVYACRRDPWRIEGLVSLDFASRVLVDSQGRVEPNT